MVLKSTRKSSPTHQMKAAVIEASPIKSRAKPPPESASPPPASTAATESGSISATSSPATSKNGDMKSPPKADTMDSSQRLTLTLKSTRKSSPTQQMKAAVIKASPIESRAKPPPESASPPPASPAETESGIIAATSSRATPKTGDMQSSPKTDTKDSSQRSAQEKSVNTLKLNELRSKYGIKPVSLGEERDEQHTEKEVDDGDRETLTVEEQQPNFIDIEKMWMSVQDMTRKAAIAINPVWNEFVGSGGESPFPPDATAEEKGLAVIAAFANYKALQAKAEQKAIAVEVGRNFCNASTSVKQLKTRNKRQKVQVAELDKAQKEKFAAKSKVMRMWSFLTPADRQAVGGLGEVEKDLFEGIEANVFLKLGKVSKDFVSGTVANPLHGMAEAFVCGGDDEATQNTSPGKVSETGKDDATETTTSSNKSRLSQKVNAFLVSPLLTKLKGKEEKDDATQQTARSNRSSLAKVGFKSLVCGDDDDATMLTENTFETGPSAGSGEKSLLAKLGKTMTCGGKYHETLLTRESGITGGSPVEEDLNACIGSDEATVITNHTSGNSLNDEEHDGINDTETKVKSLPEELAPVKNERTKSTKSVVSTRSVPIFPSAKQNLSAASVVGRAFTADDTKSVRSTKSSTKSVGHESVGDKSLDTTYSILTVKRVDTTETPKITKSVDTTSTQSVGTVVSHEDTTVVSHEDDGQSLVSNGATFVYGCATVVEAFNPRNWLQLFSREDEDETVDGSEAQSLGESVDDNDDATLTTHMTHLSKKTTVVNHNAADGIEVYRRSRKNLLKPAKFEDDNPMMAHSHKKQYEEELVPQRNCLTHAFVKCDDFFTGLFCCQDNVETKLQKSEAEEWNECYSYCKKFLHQDNDNFIDEEAFIAWLNILEAQVTTEEKSLSKCRVDKLKALLIPVAIERKRRYEELRFAFDGAMMANIHGIENIDYAIKKAGVAEFNKNYYRIMLKGENHDVVVQQVARIIEGLGFERSLPPPPPTNVHSPIDSFINYLKEMEIEIYKSDTELRFTLDKLQLSFTSVAEDNESYVSDDGCSSTYAGSVTEYTTDTNGDTITVKSRDTRSTMSSLSRSKRTRNKMFQRFLSASS